MSEFWLLVDKDGQNLESHNVGPSSLSVDIEVEVVSYAEFKDLQAKLDVAVDALDSIANQYCGESCPGWAEQALEKIAEGE